MAVRFETELLHGAHVKNEYGALQFPIYQTSTYVFQDAAEGRKRFSGESAGYFYSRMGNPTVDALQKKVALIEGGEACVAFSSGMGAISATLLTLLSCGDHLVADPVLYGCTFSLMGHLKRFGVEVTYVDCTKPEELAAALRPNTKVVYFETPCNPNMKIIDIAAVAKAAHAANPDCLVAVDNTFATPYLTRPLDLGADISIHSCTKYLNGHGDIIAGAVVAKQSVVNQIHDVGLKDMTGAVLSPHDAYLILRGMKTLKHRMDAHCENAAKVAAYLAGHPKVSAVYYPGLPECVGHDIAKRQMSAFGGILSFEVAGGYQAAVGMLDHVKTCLLAVSLGDVETLIQHPASMTHSAYSKEEREAAGFTDGLIRLSVGLEDADDIIADLEQSLTYA